LNFDKDLQAIQEVRHLCAAAKQAQQAFQAFSQEEVDSIVAAMADAGFQASEQLAKAAVRETGYGNVPDKTRKNQFSTRDIFESVRDLRTVGVIREDRKNKLLEIAEPYGVVAGIIPTTNPTSTTMFKCLISVKTRNAIIVSPHPRAVNCIVETARLMAEAAVSAGAPEGLISALTISNLKATNELLKHPDVDIILATGGTGLVRAAYSAGKPAYGVGPGNVPAYMDRSADYKKAVADVVTGKTFDYGTLCSSEQALIIDAPLKSRVLTELKNQGAYFLSQPEVHKLEQVLITKNFLINPELVGKSPQVIAQSAGFPIPEGTRLLVVELSGVGKEYPLSAEKLSPILVLYHVNGWEQGVRRSVEVLNFGGRGHTAVVHAKNDDVIREFGLRVPAYRVVVNTPASIGAVGYTNQITPSLTLGCGSFGRNITSDNISARHLMNIKRVAYETKPFTMPRTDGNWRPNIYHDWQQRQAPYTKALSPDVSRKGSAVPSRGHKTVEPAAEPVVEQEAYGSSGMSASEVDAIVAEFIKTRP